MANTVGPNSFLQRLLGAAALDSAIYEEVEADRGGTGQALAIVLLSSLAAGLGARGFVQPTVPHIVFMTAVALMVWAAWAFLTFEIGARILPDAETRVDVGELLRTTGFAATPGLLRVFGVLPGVTAPVFVITAVWMLAAMIVAVRQALDYTSTGRAIAVCVLGWALAMSIALALGLLFGPSVS